MMRQIRSVRSCDPIPDFPPDFLVFLLGYRSIGSPLSVSMSCFVLRSSDPLLSLLLGAQMIRIGTCVCWWYFLFGARKSGSRVSFECGWGCVVTVMRRNTESGKASKTSRLRIGEERAARLRNIKVNAGTPLLHGRTTLEHLAGGRQVRF